MASPNIFTKDGVRMARLLHGDGEDNNEVEGGAPAPGSRRPSPEATGNPPRPSQSAILQPAECTTLSRMNRSTRRPTRLTKPRPLKSTTLRRSQSTAVVPVHYSLPAYRPRPGEDNREKQTYEISGNNTGGATSYDAIVADGVRMARLLHGDGGDNNEVEGGAPAPGSRRPSPEATGNPPRPSQSAIVQPAECTTLSRMNRSTRRQTRITKPRPLKSTTLRRSQSTALVPVHYSLPAYRPRPGEDNREKQTYEISGNNTGGATSYDAIVEGISAMQLVDEAYGSGKKCTGEEDSELLEKLQPVGDETDVQTQEHRRCGNGNSRLMAPPAASGGEAAETRPPGPREDVQREEDKEKPAAAVEVPCICDRPTGIVFCIKCRSQKEGNIALLCRKHPQRVFYPPCFLHFCPYCCARLNKLLEFKDARFE